MPRDTRAAKEPKIFLVGGFFAESVGSGCDIKKDAVRGKKVELGVCQDRVVYGVDD